MTPIYNPFNTPDPKPELARRSRRKTARIFSAYLFGGLIGGFALMLFTNQPEVFLPAAAIVWIVLAAIDPFDPNFWEGNV